MKNTRPGTAFFLIYINGQREATQILHICKNCISSIESDVCNKKKIQMFGMNMTFNLSGEVKNCTVIYRIGTPLQFVKIIIFNHPKNWDISKIAKIFSIFLYHMNWDSAFG